MKFKFPLIMQKDQANYEVIELEAENTKLKDDLIEQLKSRIHDLEILLAHHQELKANLNPQEIPDKGFFLPFKWKGKPRIRTMTEAAQVLEDRSRRKIGEGGKSAEDLDINTR